MEAGENAVEAAAANEEAVVETPSEEQANPADGGNVAGNGDDLTKVRELVLLAHPEVVPELVRGNSIDELIASVAPARSAYQRVAESVRAGGMEVGRRKSEDGGREAEAKTVAPPAVPAGGAANVIDPSSLAPTTKIAQGLTQRRG